MNFHHPACICLLAWDETPRQGAIGRQRRLPFVTAVRIQLPVYLIVVGGSTLLVVHQLSF